MKLGEIIKVFRKKNEMTMQEFANRAGLSKGYISMLEKSQHPQSHRRLVPSFETYLKVANAMSMSIDELVALLDDNETVRLNESSSSSPDAALAEQKIGKIIKEARLDKGYTQEELASKVGVQKSAIAKWENGRVSEIKRSNLKALAVALELNPNTLLSPSAEDMLSPSSSSAPELDLTEQEEELLNGFRSLSDEQKIRVIAYLEGTLDSSGNLGAMLRSEADKIVNKEKEKATMSAKKAEVF